MEAPSPFEDTPAQDTPQNSWETNFGQFSELHNGKIAAPPTFPDMRRESDRGSADGGGRAMGGST